MTDYAETFLKESPARQLGALAATLGRVASSAEKTTRAQAIIPMLDECLQFIQWTLASQPESASKELMDLRVMLNLWREGWAHAQTDQRLRTLLSVQARKWSDQALEYSGLLSL